MAKARRRAISNRMVDALRVARDTMFWDRTLIGFGVRAYPSGSRSYVVRARGPQGPRRLTIGRHGVIGAAEARRRAAQVIARTGAGGAAGPANGPTVAEFAARYLEEHVAVRCKPATAKTVRSTVRRHIVPALGGYAMASVGPARVAALHRRLRRTPAAANAAVKTLSRMYALAARWGAVPEGTDPCRSAVMYPARRRERFLTGSEFERLGRALDETARRGGASPAALAAIRLLMLTGCRKSEVLALRWEDADLAAAALRLADSKTGPRTISLSPAAARLLAGLPRAAGNPWVFPGRRRGRPLRSIDDAWKTVRARAGLDDVRLHDLRHSWASRALALGETLPMIGRLLGHRRMETTARYAHLARDAIREPAERIAASIADDIFHDPTGADR